MSERPWYKRYGADFVHGTLGMSLEEKGAYSIVLDLIYDRQGPIPDDARYIAGACGCSVRKWNAIRERLIAIGKIVVRDDTISNFRAEKELENSAKTSRKLAESGRKGGEKSGETRRENKENNNLAEARLEKKRSIARVPEARGQKPESPPTPSRGKGSAKKAPREKAKAMALPDSIPADAWGDWVDYRFDRDRKPPPPQTLRTWINKLDKLAEAGHPPAAVVAQSIENNWAGLFELKGGPVATLTPDAMDEDRWRKFVAFFAKTGRWPETICGDKKPDEPGCRAPPHILSEFGYSNRDLFTTDDERKRA